MDWLPWSSTVVGLALAFPRVRSLSPQAWTHDVLHTNEQEKAKACCGNCLAFWYSSTIFSLWLLKWYCLILPVLYLKSPLTLHCFFESFPANSLCCFFVLSFYSAFIQEALSCRHFAAETQPLSCILFNSINQKEGDMAAAVSIISLNICSEMQGSFMSYSFICWMTGRVRHLNFVFFFFPRASLCAFRTSSKVPSCFYLLSS